MEIAKQKGFEIVCSKFVLFCFLHIFILNVLYNIKPLHIHFLKLNVDKNRFQFKCKI